MSLETVLFRLEGVKKCNGAWVARCPAHEDKVQSLSVGSSDDGKVLLNCHAGCAVEDVVGALGFEMADLFPTEQKRDDIVKTYDYRDEAGELLYQVVRLQPKSFRQRQPDGKGGWQWSIKGTRRVPYNLPAVVGSEPERWIYYTEGEKDADTLTALGVTATTHAGGSQAWLPEYADYFKGRKVAILPDNDTPGMGMATTIKAALLDTAAEVKIIKLNTAEKGDVTDWFGEGGTVERLEALTEMPPALPDGVARLSDAVGNIARYIEEPMPKGIEYPWSKVQHYTRGLRPGWLIYLAGYTGHGKTTAAMTVAVGAAKQGATVLFNSLEMSTEELAIREAQSWGLDNYRLYEGQLNDTDISAIELARGQEYTDNILVTYQRTIEGIINVVDVVQPDLLVIDYLQLVDIGSHTRLEGVTRNSHDLKNLARKFAIPVLCLSQLRRTATEKGRSPAWPTVFDLKDAGALEQDADQVILVHRKPGEDRLMGNDGCFIVGKSRHGILGMIDFVFDGAEQTFRIVDDNNGNGYWWEEDD